MTAQVKKKKNPENSRKYMETKPGLHQLEILVINIDEVIFGLYISYLQCT